MCTASKGSARAAIDTNYHAHLPCTHTTRLLRTLYFDSPAREVEVRTWLQAQMIEPLRKVGVTMQVTLLRYRNEMRKPGPAFNYMTAAAYEVY